MNHWTSGFPMENAWFGRTVSIRTGPRFSFSVNSGVLHSFMLVARGTMYSPGFNPKGRSASIRRSWSGTAGHSLRCHSGAMWMMELAMKTATADNRIGNQSAAIVVMRHLLRASGSYRRKLGPGIEFLALATAAHQDILAESGFDHDAGHVGRTANQGGGAVVQELRVADVLLVVFHVFRAPAARVRDERERRELAAEFGEEGQHLAGNGLHVVLAAGDDERDHLVAHQVAARQRLLVLDAVHALDHLVIKTAGAAPADRRRDDDHVRPVHDALVDAVELVLAVHLRDRAGPGAGARGLRIEPLAVPERQVAQPDDLRVAVAALALARGGEPVQQQVLGGAVARLAVGHRSRRNAEHANRPRLAFRLARERMRG